MNAKYVVLLPWRPLGVLGKGISQVVPSGTQASEGLKSLRLKCGEPKKVEFIQEKGTLLCGDVSKQN